MNRKSVIIALAAAALVATACKTTEENYRRAYETAMAGRTPARADSLDENTRRQLGMNRKNAYAKVITGSDTLKVHSLFVKMENDMPYDITPQYSVVVNAFTQPFNAQALLKRLREAGFEKSYIFRTGSDDYYVASDGSDDAANVPAMLKRLEAAGNPGARAGFPAIIRAAGYRPRK